MGLVSGGRKLFHRAIYPRGTDMASRATQKDRRMVVHPLSSRGNSPTSPYTLHGDHSFVPKLPGPFDHTQPSLKEPSRGSRLGHDLSPRRTTKWRYRYVSRPPLRYGDFRAFRRLGIPIWGEWRLHLIGLIDRPRDSRCPDSVLFLMNCRRNSQTGLLLAHFSHGGI